MQVRKYVNQIFEDTTIKLDGLTAIDVIFNRCVLEYNGGYGMLEGCSCTDCVFIFPSDEVHDSFFSAWADDLLAQALIRTHTPND